LRPTRERSTDAPRSPQASTPTDQSHGYASAGPRRGSSTSGVSARRAGVWSSASGCGCRGGTSRRTWQLSSQIPKRPVTIWCAELEDVPALAELEREVWGEGAASADVLRARITNVPKGNLVALDDDEMPVGFTSFCFIEYDDYESRGQCSWYDLSGGGTASTHDPHGRDLDRDQPWSRCESTARHVSAASACSSSIRHSSWCATRTSGCAVAGFP
jgi:hypothetical protein